MAIKDKKRTEGFTPARKNKNIVGNQDKWMDADGDENAGRIYPWEKLQPKGTEVLTRHLEKLSDPENLARHSNHVSDDGKYHWRAAFIDLIENLYE